MFPEDSRGQYVNKVDFGLVKADLLANYENPQKDRIDVAFEWIRFMLGPFSFKKVTPWDTVLGRAVCVDVTSCLIVGRGPCPSHEKQTLCNCALHSLGRPRLDWASGKPVSSTRGVALTPVTPRLR